MKTGSRAGVRAAGSRQNSLSRRGMHSRCQSRSSFQSEKHFATILPVAQNKITGKVPVQGGLNKKAEGAIIANLIIFVAVMAMATATVVAFKNVFDENANEAVATSERTQSMMKTDFTISSAAYNGGTIYVYVKNTGTQQFDPEDLDIYIDDLRVPRDVSNRTVSVTTDTDTVNTGIWDQKEELEFNVFQTFAVPETHTVRVTTPNGVKAEGEFSS